MNPENSQNENKIRGMFTTEVKYIIGIVVFVFGIAAPYYSIRQDIALIQKDISIINNNHLATTQRYAEDLKNLQIASNEQEKQIIELQKQLIQILSIRN